MADIKIKFLEKQVDIELERVEVIDEGCMEDMVIRYHLKGNVRRDTLDILYTTPFEENTYATVFPGVGGLTLLSPANLVPGENRKIAFSLKESGILEVRVRLNPPTTEGVTYTCQKTNINDSGVVISGAVVLSNLLSHKQIVTRTYFKNYQSSGPEPTSSHWLM